MGGVTAAPRPVVGSRFPERRQDSPGHFLIPGSNFGNTKNQRVSFSDGSGGRGTAGKFRPWACPQLQERGGPRPSDPLTSLL